MTVACALLSAACGALTVPPSPLADSSTERNADSRPAEARDASTSNDDAKGLDASRRDSPIGDAPRSDTATDSLGPEHESDVASADAQRTDDARPGRAEDALSDGFAVGDTSDAAVPSDLADAGDLETLRIVPTTVTVPRGGRISFRLDAQFAGRSDYVDVTSAAAWTSSDPVIAPLLGNVAALDVPGVAEVRATFRGLIATTPIVVIDAMVTSITVSLVNAREVPTPDNNVCLLSAPRFRAEATTTDGRVVDLSYVATWSSSNINVVTTPIGGRVMCVGGGTTVIAATFGAITGSITMHSSTAELTTYRMVGPGLLPPRSTAAFELHGIDSNGELTGALPAVWQSSNPDVLTASTLVSSDVNARDFRAGVPGSAVVTATLGGVQVSSRNIVVSDATLQSITLSPPSLD